MSDEPKPLTVGEIVALIARENEQFRREAERYDRLRRLEADGDRDHYE